MTKTVKNEWAYPFAILSETELPQDQHERVPAAPTAVNRGREQRREDVQDRRRHSSWKHGDFGPHVGVYAAKRREPHGSKSGRGGHTGVSHLMRRSYWYHWKVFR